MDMQNNEPIRMPPRRRRRSKMQIFKEAYLPTIILAATLVMIAVFIIGGVTRGRTPDGPVLSNPSGSSNNSSEPGTTNKPGNTGNTGNTEGSGSSSQTPGTSTKPTVSPTNPTVDPTLAQEAEDLLAQAALLAKDYDYAGAVAKLESFSGIKTEFPALVAAINRYQAADDAMVTWNAADVYDLSFHVLIADPQRAFNDAVYKKSYRNNFITTTEFSRILDALYAGGYILVDLDDFYGLEFNSTSGTEIYVEKQLRLPPDKKPIMLTEISASYYAYMQNGAQDGMADGFANRLAFDGQSFYNELINADGSVSAGAYDMVPLLEAFIKNHPDFSYRGARAVISFAGYDRILGYRINDNSLSADALQLERDGLKATVNALKAAGYKLGCYTYNNVNYTNMSAEDIFTDISKWEEKVTPWLGAVDIMVFAREGDIGGEDPYIGNSKFNVLYNAGFRYFLGAGSTPWSQVADRYVRHRRLMVTGSYLKNNPELYASVFDVAKILDEARNG